MHTYLYRLHGGRCNRLPAESPTTGDQRPRGWPRHGLIALLVALAGLLLWASGASAAPSPTQREDLRFLLLSSDGTEPALAAWQQALQQEGIPYDTFVANSSPAITAATLADGTTRARYQAIVMADDLVPLNLTADELSAIRAFEVSFGVRQIDAFVFPSSEEDLTYANSGGPMSSLGTEATLTAAGRTVFPYLTGRISFEPSAWGYTATPAGANVTPLVTTPGGSTLLATVAWPDGRQEMASTVSVGPSMIQGLLLLRGQIAWATENVSLGMWRNYFAAHIDDIFLGDDRWDTVNKTTHEDDGATLPMIRMAPADVTRAVNWERANGIKLDFVFNGQGMDDAIATNGSDPLSTALLQNKSAFRWINHTYDHMDLNTATQAQIQSEINQNIQFARLNGIPVSRQELVTGGHSGLGSYTSLGLPGLNPAMPPALANTGVTWVGDDDSVQHNQRAIGPALTVPRHPSNIYYNVGTFAEQLDEYNWIYTAPPLGGCVNTAVTTCRTQPATWDEYVNSEASIMLKHLITNDPRPHYMHQANLAEDGTFYPVVDEVLSRYRSYFTPALVNPTMSDSGTELQRQAAWAAANAAGTIAAYRLGANVVVTNAGSRPVQVPVTGTGNGATYGGLRSRWVNVPAGRTVNFPINAAP
jgi:hypothetical protein